jgi:signal transduction histidine kinase
VPAGDAGGAPLLPAPGLADLGRLISRTASAGVEVDVTRCGQPRELPASIDLSAYRIVQEALPGYGFQVSAHIPLPAGSA